MPLTYTRQKRDRQLQRRYGITQDDYEKLLADQGGACAICRSPEPEHRALDVDHCHVTGRVRGLLCNPCNRALGKFRDNIPRIVAAVAYLVKPQEKP